MLHRRWWQCGQSVRVRALVVVVVVLVVVVRDIKLVMKGDSVV